MTSASSQPYRYRTRNGDPPLGTKLTSAAFAACCADLLTFPLDTAKVRMQIGNSNISDSHNISKAVIHKTTAPQRPSLLGTLRHIYVKEGPTALYSGLSAGLQRQIVFASIRIGLYDDVKVKYQHMLGRDDHQKHNMDIRILAGLTTGAISVSVGQPTDVVKIRMQAQGATGTVLYRGALHAYRQIARREGVQGLWRGYLPNATRNSLTNVGELVTYDVIKEYLLYHNLLQDNFVCHVISGLGAGFFATLIASPVDVVKTRYMSSPPSTYSGVLDCAATVLRQNGPMAFYKGFVPSFMRFGSWNIVMFVCYEKVKAFIGQFNRPNDILKQRV